MKYYFDIVDRFLKIKRRYYIYWYILLAANAMSSSIARCDAASWSKTTHKGEGSLLIFDLNKTQSRQTWFSLRFCMAHDHLADSTTMISKPQGFVRQERGAENSSILPSSSIVYNNWTNQFYEHWTSNIQLCSIAENDIVCTYSTRMMSMLFSVVWFH